MRSNFRTNWRIIFVGGLLALVLMLYGILSWSEITIFGIDISSEAWWLLILIMIIGVLLIWLWNKKKIKLISLVLGIILTAAIAMVLSNVFTNIITGADAATREAKRQAKEAQEQLAEEQKPVPCASKAKDGIETIDGMTMEIYAISGELTSEGVIDTSKKIDKNTFNIQALKTNIGDEGLNDIVAIAKITDGQSRDYATWMQVCDGDNKTKKRNELPEFNENYIFSQGESQFVTIKNIETIPLQAGQHRIDGYIYINGKWHLTARIENVDFIDEQILEEE